jgi:hypothetical protein
VSRKPRLLPSVSVSEKSAAREALMIEQVRCGPQKMCEAVYLLIVAHSRVEREIVALVICGNRTIADAAAAIELMPSRAAELLKSLRARLRVAQQRGRLMELLSDSTKPGKSRPASRRALQPMNPEKRVEREEAAEPFETG